MSECVKTSHPSICLALATGKQGAGLARCLDAVRGLVSSFVILNNAGAAEHAREIAAATGCREGGKVIEVDPDRAGNPVTLLYAEASRLAEYVLFMHPDELLREAYRCAPAEDVSVYRIEIDYGRCSFMQPRLMRSGMRGVQPDPFRSAAATRDAGLADQLRIQRQSPGPLRASTRDNGFWQQLPMYGESGAGLPQDFVQLAMRSSMQGDLDGALGWLSAGLAECEDDETGWQLQYLLGLARLDGGDRGAAIECFARAWELDPVRLEPLYHLARMKLVEGDLIAAAELSRLALDVDIPLSRGYFERTLYERDRYVQHMVILERLERREEARETCRLLLQSLDLPNDLRRFLETTAKRCERLLEAVADTVTATAKTAPPLLTIGMAVVNDYDGVYFTLMSFFLYHRDCLDRLEFLVLDNNPEGPSSAAIQQLCESLGLRYVAVPDYRSTAVRDSLFRLAGGHFVLCLDAHVMLAPGALTGLIDYLRQNPRTDDLLQGPLVDDRGERVFTHLEGRWKDGMYGIWVESEPDSLPPEPFEIPMQGLGLFCCRREAWPGLNPRFSGFGGEEGYLHDKVRRAGGRLLCLPWLKWIHRFQRPLGVPYPMNWPDRIRNYLIGHDELGWNQEELCRHFARVVGFAAMADAFADFERERRSSFYLFDAIFFLDHDTSPEISAEMSERFEELGMSSRIRRIAMGSRRGGRRLRQTLDGLLRSSIAHRYDRLLVISSLDLLPHDFEGSLGHLLAALEQQTWDICFLGSDGIQAAETTPGPSRVVAPGSVVDSERLMESISTFRGSFLVNLGLEPGRIEAWLQRTTGKAPGPGENGPMCISIWPTITVARKDFAGADDPTRYCPVSPGV